MSTLATLLFELSIENDFILQAIQFAAVVKFKFFFVFCNNIFSPASQDIF